MRTPASEAAIALRRALGAEPVLVEWENIYGAFEGGLIDTLLVPAAYFGSLEMHKVAEQATLFDYGYTLNTTVAMNEPAYRTLSPGVQRVLMEAVEETGTYCTQLANTQTLAHLHNLSEEHGVPVIRPQQGAWRAAFRAAIREVCSGGLLPPGTYDELQAL
jgi:TRAP-type C4-dicarboxylate transport system substrate-binding protein